MGVLPENYQEVMSRSQNGDIATSEAYRGTTLHWIKKDTPYGLNEFGLDNMQEICFFDVVQFGDSRKAYERAVSTARDKVSIGSYADRNGIDTIPIVLELEAPENIIYDDGTIKEPDKEVLYDRHPTDEKELRALYQIPKSHISTIHFLDEEPGLFDIPETSQAPVEDPDLKEMQESGGRLATYYQ
jgi:hypothetical protein